MEGGPHSGFEFHIGAAIAHGLHMHMEMVKPAGRWGRANENGSWSGEKDVTGLLIDIKVE